MSRKKLLNEEQVRAINSSLGTTGVTALAKEYGVSRQTVYRAIDEFAKKSPSAAEVTKRVPFGEFGVTGLQRFGGTVREDYNRTWQNLMTMVPLVKEMLDHPIVGATMFAVEMYIRTAEWSVVPGGDSAGDEAARTFLEECMNDMSHTFADHITQALSMLSYGFAPFEIVYKRRQGPETKPVSEFDDGRIGWRKFAFRSQDTLAPGHEWEFDPNGGIKGMYQKAEWTKPEVFIPIEKMILYRTTAAKNNPQGRPFPLDTVVPTPDGWTTIGEINVGDQVFDEKGQARLVTGKSDIFKNQSIYEIEFTTGATIKADASHLWQVTTHNDRFNSKEPRDLTTEQLAQYIDRGKPNHFSCGSAPIIDCAERYLSLDPYVLGYWLGDGSKGKATISVALKDFSNLKCEMEAAGYTVSYTNNITANISGGLLSDLRSVDVLHEKHIPSVYMRASQEQRLALLQGLMDSDGSPPNNESKDKANRFCNTNISIVKAVSELVRSLGGQPRISILEEAGAFGGVVRDRQIVAKQTSYIVRFMLDLPVYRLPRKRDAQVCRKTSRNSSHFIRTIRPAGKADTVCIEVNSPSQLFLVGEAMIPTHNSALRAAYMAWYYAKNFAEIEGISAERMGGGLPVIYLGEGTNKAGSKSDFEFAKSVVRDVRSDEQAGIVFPFQKQGQDGRGVLFELVSPPAKGVVDFNRAIMRYNQQISQTLLAQFIFLGLTEYGTQSLAIELTDLFAEAMNGWLSVVTDVLNRYIVPRLFAFNTFSVEHLPQFSAAPTQDIDVEKMLNAITLAVGSGVLLPDEGVDRAVRKMLDFPQRGDPDSGQVLSELPEYKKAKEAEMEAQVPPGGGRSQGDTQDAVGKVRRHKDVRDPKLARQQKAGKKTTLSAYLADKFAALRRKQPGLPRTWEEIVNEYQHELGDMWEEFTAAVAVAIMQVDDSAMQTEIALSMINQFADDMAFLGREYIFDGAVEGLADTEPDGSLLAIAGMRMATNEGFIDQSLVPSIKDRLTTFFSDPANVITSVVIVAMLMPMQARVESYAGQAWAAINEATGEYARKNNLPVYWQRDSLAEHCESCLEFGEREYASFDILLAETGHVLPSDGTICRGNCRCSLLIDEGEGWVRP